MPVPWQIAHLDPDNRFMLPAPSHTGQIWVLALMYLLVDVLAFLNFWSAFSVISSIPQSCINLIKQTALS